MFRERRPDLLTGARHNVEDAFRQMPLAEACERECRERRVRRRLQHDGIPGDQRGGHLPRADQDRDVPRHDRGNDTPRLAARVREHVLAERDRLALELTAKPTEVAEQIGRRPRLGARLSADRVAGLRRKQTREFFDRGLEVIRDA